jgi:hypothetical protein
VAVSDKPASGFKVLPDYIGGLDGNAMIDPCVFTDTDGTAYFYYGGGGVCKGGKLKKNMTEIDGEMQKMAGLVDFHEGTWVFKRNGIYYLTYADNHRGLNRLQYATSSSPLGPWTPKGVYLDVTDCDTSHGSAVEYKGQWYQFYHNKSLSGQGNLRSICVDKLNFNEDGTIQMVVQTKTGPGPKANPDAMRYGIEAAGMGGEAKVVEDSAASGGKTVQNLHLEGSYLEWKNIDGKNGGRATIDIYYATADNAKVKLTVNGEDLSFVNARGTGGWSDYSGHSYITVPLKAGKSNTIRLDGGYGGVNVDYITVTPLR